MLPEVRVRRGDNKHVVVLPLKKMEESVTVAQNAQAAAADPRGNAFKTVLSREEIENLSDDPAEMAQQLQDLAGGNATIRVDSFSGAPLPPKALIKSIHIVRDPFAAENHSAESEGIDIITQPGQGALSGGFTSRLRDGALSARSPFVSEKGPERQERVEGNIGGTLIKGKSSFALSVEGRNAFDTPVINVALPDGSQRSELLDLRRPSTDWSVYGLVDYALTRDQTLRLSYDYGRTTQDNLGVGGSDLKERAYSTTSQDHELRAQLVGPLGRRTFANTRLQLQMADSSAVSVTAAQTVIVNGAFTAGGAQVQGGRHPRTYEAASDVDYVRGMHTIRFGFLAAGGQYRSDNATNRLGTFTFSSLDAFNAGRPDTYTQRIGDPRHRVLQRADSRLCAGRHPRPQEPDAEPRHPLRDPDAPERWQQPRAAHGRHVGAVQEWTHDAARQLRRLLQLAERDDLRADASRRRLPSTRPLHHQPGFSGAWHGWNDLDDQQVSARTGRADGARPARERGH